MDLNSGSLFHRNEESIMFIDRSVKNVIGPVLPF